MLKCNLSKILGARRIKVIELARAIDVDRGTIARIYKEDASRVDLDVIAKICIYLNIDVGDLYELVDRDDIDSDDASGSSSE